MLCYELNLVGYMQQNLENITLKIAILLWIGGKSVFDRGFWLSEMFTCGFGTAFNFMCAYLLVLVD